MADPKQDNGQLRRKVQLRRRLLALCDAPVVMETHGGNGVLWRHCYTEVPRGVVFEHDPKKTARLGRQRPHWAVYEADGVRAIAAGAGRHLPVNFVDIDPYGDPWPTLDAFFASVRPRPDQIAVVVTDGLRQKLQYGGAWQTGSLAAVVQRYGNDLYPVYLDVCQELLREKAAGAGYALDRFTGFYCGHTGIMTLYGAILRRELADVSRAA